ncbi:ABC transporter permease [Clostridium boliviensis]|uniref:ABC transporter permease n=1 Tax=Clostridium boliviensis TaxID=318465 RepID=A0ABU4GTF2_9CLOT|nr:ABC transporter permease [Clostridium boliviensis]MDW2800828.1 ABC transporter permease [Clostridium boliviensis]
MWKLIRLEWKKNNMKKYIIKQAVVIAILGILFFAMCYYIPIDDELGISESVPEVENMQVQIDLLTNIVFLVITSSMLSSFIIKAYKNKTQSLMFCYPISRKKIILSQMMAVWIFCAAALFLGKLFICLLLVLSSGVGTSIPLGYDLLSANFYLQIILKTVLTVTLAFIPLYIGKLMKSSRAVIITSFLLFSVMNGNIGDLTLRANTVLPVLLFGVSLICGFLTMHNVEKEDVN